MIDAQMQPHTLWRDLDLGLSLDTSTCPPPSDDASAWDAAFAAMAALEAGAIANPDEGRQVGHYWLRNAAIAPENVQKAIEDGVVACQRLAMQIYKEKRFKNLLLLGIGGSALGPQFVSEALREPEDHLRVHLIDNTDPDGMARVIGPLDLEETIVVCISKSGKTPETRNALIEVQAAYERAEVAFAERAIAISQEGSDLWQQAADWRARLPMWDWVGGRTSLCSAVGLLPLALQGIDTEAFLEGAAAMDQATRRPDVNQNPAAILARAWYNLGEGHGKRAMVVLPYRDRLLLFSKYLQQLVMESIGKETDLQGNIVHQGLTVYGNKGSTDQHAFVQQLRDGPDDHFVTLIGVLDDGYRGELVGPGIEAGDYLQGLMLGTRKALSVRHPVITLMLSTVDAFRMGALIALYERAVGLYAARIGINAYHQPGVEAGKQAANAILAMKAPLLAALNETPQTTAELCAQGNLGDIQTAWYLLSRLATLGDIRMEAGSHPENDRFMRAN